MALNLSWEPRNLPEGRWMRFRFGPLSVVILHLFGEWRISTWEGDQYDELPDEGEPGDLPSSLEWQRWDGGEDDLQIQLCPGFPELPIIAKPKPPLTLTPGGHALFYIGIPACIEVHGQCDGTLRKLTSISTDPLSKTWHGDRSRGEVCYSLRTRARRAFDPAESAEHNIIVAVDLKNESAEPFVFDRLFLDLGHFSIFHHDDRLWSNACRIRVTEDDEEGNAITYAPKPLGIAAKAPEVAAARAGKTRQSKIRRAFSSVIDVIQ